MPSGKRRVHSVSGRHYMTTADGKHSAFSGRHPKLFIISDLYLGITEIDEVYADIARSILKCIIPLLL